MGKKQSRSLRQLLAGPGLNLPSHLNRWFLSSLIIVPMMALSTFAVAAELPPQKTPAALEGRAPKLSQRIRRKNIWQAVQKQLPDLPLENRYTSNVTGNISETNTLVRRMIEYHNFRKGRSPRSRFDWKLTLADYLGIHDVIFADSYPSANKLTTNPITGDRAAIQAMSREQRDQLINTLVSLYDPRIPPDFFTPADPNAAPQAQPNNPPSAPTSTQPEAPPLAEPGAADLLRPRP